MDSRRVPFHSARSPSETSAHIVASRWSASGLGAESVAPAIDRAGNSNTAVAASEIHRAFMVILPASAWPMLRQLDHATLCGRRTDSTPLMRQPPTADGWRAGRPLIALGGLGDRLEPNPRAVRPASPAETRTRR